MVTQFLPWRALEAGTFRINRLRVTAPPARLVTLVDRGAETSVTGTALRSVPALQYVAEDFLTTMAGAMSVEQHPAGAQVHDGDGESRFVIVVGPHETFQVISVDAPTVLVYRSQRGGAQVSWANSDSAQPHHVPDPPEPSDRTGERKWLVNSGGELIDLLTVAGLAAGLRERLPAQ